MQPSISAITITVCFWRLKFYFQSKTPFACAVIEAVPLSVIPEKPAYLKAQQISPPQVAASAGPQGSWWPLLRRCGCKSTQWKDERVAGDLPHSRSRKTSEIQKLWFWNLAPQGFTYRWTKCNFWQVVVNTGLNLFCFSGLVEEIFLGCYIL